MSAKTKKEQKEQSEQKEKDGLLDQFRKIELTPIPHFVTELLPLPKETMEFLRDVADEHNCTTSYVIEHFLEDLLSETKELSEITEEVLINASKDKEKIYMLIKKNGKPFARISFFHEEDFTRVKEKKA